MPNKVMFRLGLISVVATAIAAFGINKFKGTLPGVSGGAVPNQNGELVATHDKGDRQKNSSGEADAKTRFIREISINRLATIVSNLSVNLDEKVAAIPQGTQLKAVDYLKLGDQKFRKEDYRGALANYNQAIRLDSTFAKAYNNRGLLKGNTSNDRQGALADLNQAIRLDRTFAQAYYNRGLLKQDMLKDIQGALADLNEAIRVDPTFAKAYRDRSLIRQNKCDQGGQADLDEAIRVDPTFAKAHRDYLLTIENENNVDPTFAKAYHDRVLIRKNKCDQGALADFNEAIRLDPNSAEGYYNRATLNIKNLKDSQGVLADYNEAIRLNPNYVGAYVSRGLYKENLNDHQGALANFNEAIRLEPNDAFLYYFRGLFKYHQLNDRPGAIADMKKVPKRSVQLNNASQLNNALQLSNTQSNLDTYFHTQAIEQLKEWGVTDPGTGF